MRSLSVITGIFLLLLWPWIYNGSVMFYGDSFSYFQSWFNHSVTANRPSYYPYLLGMAIGMKSIQWIAVIQAGVASLMLGLLLQSTLKLAWPVALAIGAVLSICTTVGWWTATAMSDTFFTTALVGAVVLRHTRLKWGWQAAIYFLFAVAMLMHLALPAVMIIWLGLMIGADWIFRRRIRRCDVALLLIAILAVPCYAILNGTHGNGYRTSTETDKFVAARMMADGTISHAEVVSAVKGLDVAQRRTLLQQYQRIMRVPRSEVPVSTTWNGYRTGLMAHQLDSPLEHWSEQAGIQPLHDLVFQTIERHPLRAAGRIVAGAGRLLLLPTISLWISDASALGPTLRVFFNESSPAPSPMVARGKQAAGALHLPFWNILIACSYYISAAICILLAGSFLLHRHWFQSENLPGIRAGIDILVFVLVHAVMIYALSGDFIRYQSRVSWLVPLAAIAFLASLPGVPLRRGRLLPQRYIHDVE